MTFVHPFGTLGMICQILIVGTGFPSQIWKLHREKSTKALSLYSCSLNVLCQCLLLVNSTVEVPNTNIATCMAPSVVMGAIVIGQIVYYRYFYAPMPVPAS